MEMYVGEFTEKDLINEVDKVKIAEAKASTGLNYIKSKFIKKGSKIVGMKVWVCDYDSCYCGV